MLTFAATKLLTRPAENVLLVALAMEKPGSLLELSVQVTVTELPATVAVTLLGGKTGGGAVTVKPPTSGALVPAGVVTLTSRAPRAADAPIVTVVVIWVPSPLMLRPLAATPE